SGSHRRLHTKFFKCRETEVNRLLGLDGGDAVLDGFLRITTGGKPTEHARTPRAALRHHQHAVVQPLANPRRRRKPGPGTAPRIEQNLGAARKVRRREARQGYGTREMTFETAPRQAIDDRPAPRR